MRPRKISVSFDASDLELVQQHSKPKQKTELEKDKDNARLLQTIKHRIADEIHKLAAKRDKLAKEALRKAELFIAGLKKRYNQLYKDRYGETYYHVTAAAKQKITGDVLIKTRYGSYHGGMQQVSNVNGADVLWNFVKVVAGKYVIVPTQAEATGIVCGKKFYEV